MNPKKLPISLSYWSISTEKGKYREYARIYRNKTERAFEKKARKCIKIAWETKKIFVFARMLDERPQFPELEKSLLYDKLYEA